MKNFILILIAFFLAVSCGKTEFAPEGPTDIRIRNLTDLDLREVIIKTSEYEEDVDTISLIPAHETSEFIRFRKAYPLLEVTAGVEVDNSVTTFSTGPVDFTYLQYLSTQRVTFEIYIPNMNTGKIEIDELIPEEELILK